MSACTPFIQTIYPAECLSDSLIKINTNFANLQTKVCNIKETVDSLIEVRTFWYYGPNAQNDPTSGMQSGVTSRPSNNTIQTFVNSQSQLNLPSISNNNDIAYVIFQKTGFRNNQLQGITVNYMFGDHRNNLLNEFAPTFFIWRLTYNGTEYTITPGFPKINRAQGQDNNSWYQPQNWTTY
jgi:hypothetical protein